MVSWYGRAVRAHTRSLQCALQAVAGPQREP